MSSDLHLVNIELLSGARRQVRLGGFGKQAFVPGADMSGGGGGAPPQGGDPAMGGGDPAAQGGGAPPQGGGGGGDPMAALQPMIQQMVQQQMQQMGGGAGGGGAGGQGAASGAPLKPKIDVNVELMQIKNMIAMLCDKLGVQIPAQDMVATPDKLMAMSQGQSTASGAGGAAGGAGGAGGGAIGGMPPMDPMAGAGVPGGEKTGSYRANGIEFDRSQLTDVANRASMIASLRRVGRQHQHAA